jgi:phenylacetate-CoA ligase
MNYARAFYTLNQLANHAYWRPSRLEEYQNKQLRRLIRHAYDTVPFYHRKLREAHLIPADIKTKADLNKLPVIRKKEIKQNAADLLSRSYDFKKLRMVSTSGSTGEPLFVYLSALEVEFRKAKHLRANISVGQKAWHRWVTLVGPQHVSKTGSLQRLLGLYVPVTLSVYNDAQTQIRLLETLQPNVLDGYSSSLLVLAQAVERQGTKNFNPHFLIGGAELIDSHSRKYIQRVFNAPFYDQYSSVEFERMAWQCTMQDEYHMDSDAVVMQFLNKNGQETAAGETGEVVCTSLFNYAMPLIRYAIGDIGIPSDGVCGCGRTLPLMKMVEGRKDALLLLPSGQMLTPRAFTYAVHDFRFYPEIEKFRIIQNTVDSFEFNLKMKNPALPQDMLRRELYRHLSSLLDLQGARFEINFVDDIPLDKNGKLSIVVSKLSPASVETAFFKRLQAR